MIHPDPRNPAQPLTMFTPAWVQSVTLSARDISIRLVTDTVTDEDRL